MTYSVPDSDIVGRCAFCGRYVNLDDAFYGPEDPRPGFEDMGPVVEFCSVRCCDKYVQRDQEARSSGQGS